MRRRSLWTTFITCSVAACLSAAAAPALATPNPTADYRFNGNLKSSVKPDDRPKLKKVGDGFVFKSRKVGGKTDKFLQWEEGTGLKVANATKVLGPGGDYTIAMLVRLTEIDGYRKLVDFDNLQTDRGFYQYSGYLYPYDVDGVEEPDPLPIVAGKWHILVMTRHLGKVRGYVDGERFFTLSDPEEQGRLGADEILHFLIDDEGTEDEETGGRISRIRIWKNPLTNKEAKGLGKTG